MNKLKFRMTSLICVLVTTVFFFSCGFNQVQDVSFTVNLDGIAKAREVVGATTGTAYALTFSLYNASSGALIQSVSREIEETSTVVNFDDIPYGIQVYITAQCKKYSVSLTNDGSYAKTITACYEGKSSTTKVTTNTEINLSLSYATSFTIASASELAEFATLVNSSDHDYTSMNGTLQNDIDLSSVCSETLSTSWTPIGQSTTYEAYNGTFDGCGHTISSLYILFESKETETDEGLFSAIGTAAIIKNVSVEGTITVTSSGKICCGGICGFSKGNIVNCLNKCHIIGTTTTSNVTTYVGGIVGYVSSGVILNCANTSILSATASSTSTSGDGTSISTSSATPGAIVGYGSSGGMYNCYWLYSSDMPYSGCGSKSDSFASESCLPYNTNYQYFQSSTDATNAEKNTSDIPLYTLSGSASTYTVTAADAKNPGVVLNAWVKNIGGSSYYSWEWDSDDLSISLED